MSKKFLVAVAVFAAVCVDGIWGGSAYGGSTPVNWRVAGTIVYVQVPLPTSDNVIGFLIQASLNGAPGNGRFTVLGFPGGDVVVLDQCKAVFNSFNGFGLTFSPNDMVITFDDLSMLFAKLGEDGGWLCFRTDGKVTAVANMTVTGGSGRFEGAGGWFVGVFEGQTVGDSGALSAETGTITGRIDR